MPFIGCLWCIKGLLRSFPAQHRAGGSAPTWSGCAEECRAREKTRCGLLGIVIKTESICLWLQGSWVRLRLSHLMYWYHVVSSENAPNLMIEAEWQLFCSSMEDASVPFRFRTPRPAFAFYWFFSLKWIPLLVYLEKIYILLEQDESQHLHETIYLCPSAHPPLLLCCLDLVMSGNWEVGFLQPPINQRVTLLHPVSRRQLSMMAKTGLLQS